VQLERHAAAVEQNFGIRMRATARQFVGRCTRKRALVALSVSNALFAEAISACTLQLLGSSM
jgi:hypothetical protein